MRGRKLFSTGPVAVVIAVVALAGGCREATTGPSDPNPAALASAMQVVSGNTQTGQIGAALSQQLAVKIVDAGGVPVQGAVVNFAARTGGGTIVPPNGTSNAAGMVTAIWTLGTSIGAQTAVAILSGSFVSDSATFNATATTGPAGVITLVTGNNQSSVVGKALSLPLVVKVTDTYGNNAVGTRVTWAAAGLSGSVNPPTDTTGADGTASVVWTLGNTASTQTVTATVAGLLPITFSATAAPDTGHITIIASAGAGQTGGVGAALPTNIAVRVTDQFGNPIVGDKITWNGTVTGGATVSAASSLTDATGTAATTLTLGNRAGTQTLQAVEASKSLSTGFVETANVAFSDVFAGNFMACGIAASNNLTYCWGVGDGGQLGKGVLTNNVSAPTTPVATTSDTLNGPFLQIRQVSGGDDGFCALTIDRRLFCWGRLIGTSAVTSAFAAAQTITTGAGSQQVLPNFIAMGEQHICLLDLSGSAFCTGSDQHGELGDSTLGVSPSVGTFPFVKHTPPQGWARITAGQAFTCGIPRFDPKNAANSQIPRCWGLNTTGQVGNDSTSGLLGQQVPSLVLPAVVTAFDSTSITAGAQHACAITAPAFPSGGQAYCWGGNGSGQLGTGQSLATIDSIPTAVSGGAPFVKIYAGTYHTCAIDANGNAWCWGRNDYGQLGNNTNVNSATPVPVGGGIMFRSLSVGELYTCGVQTTQIPLTPASGPSATAGTVYCWGNNLFGQIGNGSTSNSTAVMIPTKVMFQP